MTTIPQLSQAMQTLLTTTETIAAALAYVKRPDRAKFCNGQRGVAPSLHRFDASKKLRIGAVWYLPSSS